MKKFLTIYVLSFLVFFVCSVFVVPLSIAPEYLNEILQTFLNFWSDNFSMHVFILSFFISIVFYVVYKKGASYFFLYAPLAFLLAQAVYYAIFPTNDATGMIGNWFLELPTAFIIALIISNISKNQVKTA